MIPAFQKWSQMQVPLVMRAFRSLSQQRRRTIGSCSQNNERLERNAPGVKRNLTISTRNFALAVQRPILTNNDINEYLDGYKDLLNDLGSASERIKCQEITDFYLMSLDYNLATANKQIGLIALSVYKNLVRGNDLTPDKLKLAQKLAWSVELLYVALFVTDDMTDDGDQRRGKTCYPKLEAVGKNAINGVIMMLGSCFDILRIYFRHLDGYTQLVDLFNLTIFKSASGQTLDVLASQKNISAFNRELYHQIVVNKVGDYFIQLPVLSALHLAGVKDKQVFDESYAISKKLGIFFQSQNDFADVYFESTLDKAGEDIVRNRCTWLSAWCMDLATPEQRAIMEECYGKSDPTKVARVKQLYDEMKMPEVWAKYEEDMYKDIQKHIHLSSPGVPREALLDLLETIANNGII